MFPLYMFLLVIATANTEDCYEVLNKPEPNCCNEKPLFNPCHAVKCAAPCVLHYNPKPNPPNCTDDYFPLEARCQQPCKTFKCAGDCVPFLNGDRCNDCKCEKECKNQCIKHKCGTNEECYHAEVICVKEPCCPQPQCRPICKPEETCPKNCLPYLDQFGCKKCHCCNACVNHKCPNGQKCVLDPVVCVKCPCPPLAKCKKHSCDDKED